MTKPPAVFTGASTILGIAHWAPETRTTTAELERSITAPLDSPLGIEARLGVAEKRDAGVDMSIADMAMQAVGRLLAQRTFGGDAVDPADIDLFLFFGVMRQWAEPATAALIQHRLGATGASAFDVSNACLGFFDAWAVADAMIASGRISRALLVSAERATDTSDIAVSQINEGQHPRDHFAALSLGDGAVAVLVGGPGTGERGLQLVAGNRASYTEHVHLCVLPALHLPMLTKAGRLFNAALSKFPPLVLTVLERSGWQMDDIDALVTHQASMASIQKGCEVLGVPVDKSFNTIREYGNMASVSAPFTLSKMIADRGIQDGARVLLVGFGSGLGVSAFTLTARLS